MCRFTLYKGKKILLADVLLRPENSLIRQSRDAGYHPGCEDALGKRNIRVNGDGFGICWYNRPNLHVIESALSGNLAEVVRSRAASDAVQQDTVSTEGSDGEEKKAQGKRPSLTIPQEELEDFYSYHCIHNHSFEACTFKFITPAWHNRNLRNLGNHIMSELIMGHVRAASTGLSLEDDMKVVINEENCHPFTYKHWSFMHNGGIPEFYKIRLQLLQLLDPEVFLGITGNTDSEHIFALFLSLLPLGPEDLYSVEVVALTIEQTIATIVELCTTYASIRVAHACSMNLCVSDGISIVATRYRSGKAQPPSLYYNWGSQFKCDELQGHFQSSGHGPQLNDIVISSAPLCRHSEVIIEPEPEYRLEEDEGDIENSSSHSKDSVEDGHLSVNTNSSLYPCEIIRDRNWMLQQPKKRHGSYSDLNDAFATLSSQESSTSLQQLNHLGAMSPLTPGGPASGVMTPVTPGKSNDHQVYAKQGEWVLMPKNHMIVVVGDKKDPEKVRDVYLCHMSLQDNPLICKKRTLEQQQKMRLLQQPNEEKDYCKLRQVTGCPCCFNNDGTALVVEEEGDSNTRESDEESEILSSGGTAPSTPVMTPDHNHHSSGYDNGGATLYLNKAEARMRESDNESPIHNLCNMALVEDTGFRRGVSTNSHLLATASKPRCLSVKTAGANPYRNDRRDTGSGGNSSCSSREGQDSPQRKSPLVQFASTGSYLEPYSPVSTMKRPGQGKKTAGSPSDKPPPG